MSDNLQPINDVSSKVFDELFSRYQNLDINAIMISLFDSVNAEALPHLAEQFHITGNEGWNNCKNEKEKRELIKNSLNLHKFRGTKYALVKVLDVLGLNGKVTEWFEYGGKPYHFKVSVEITDSSFDLSTEEQLYDLLEENKNVRSKLEQVVISLVNNASLSFINYVVTSEEMTVWHKIFIQ